MPLSYPTAGEHTYTGMPNVAAEEADVIILPVPYDSTTSYHAGTRNGPDAIIRASQQMELFDLEFKKNIVDFVKIHTALPLEPDTDSPEKMVGRVEDVIKQIIQIGKFPVMLGGEHSITAAIKPFSFRYSNLSVLQIDAHADMRDSWEGSKYNHACVMRRVREFCKNTVSVGIRSISQEDYEYIKQENVKVFYPFFRHTPQEIVNSLTENVYVTIDLDGLDPSVMPAVGTPVTGGLRWGPILRLMRELFARKNVVGVDVVELIPRGGTDTRSEDLASLLIYKMIGYKFRSRIQT